MKTFITGGIAVVALILASAGYAYLVADITANIARAGEARSDAESLTVRDASARAMEMFLQSTTDERAALAAYVIPASDVAAPIAVIEDAAKRAKVTASISAISIVDLRLGSHEGVEVSVSATAPFASLMRFATYLGSLPVTSRLERASFEATKDGWFGTFRLVFVKEK